MVEFSSPILLHVNLHFWLKFRFFKEISVWKQDTQENIFTESKRNLWFLLTTFPVTYNGITMKDNEWENSEKEMGFTHHEYERQEIVDWTHLAQDMASVRMVMSLRVL